MRRFDRQIPVICVAVLALAACQTVEPAVEAVEAVAETPDPGPQPVTFLAINDVHQIQGAGGERLGGLARVRTLRIRLEAESGAPALLLHAGSVLSPSLMARQYGGAATVDLMNALDGVRGEMDPYMFVVFGNREFDDSDCSDLSALAERIAGSEFTWLGSNIDFAGCGPAGAEIEAMPQVQENAIVELDGATVGLFGLLPDFPEAERLEQPRIADILETARYQTALLRSQGADIVVALTHLDAEDDLRLLRTLGGDGPDFIVGGRDHDAMSLPQGAPRIFKADSDARSAQVIRATPATAEAPLMLRAELRTLDRSVPEDAEGAALAAEWASRFGAAFCTPLGEPADCLLETLGRTATVLEGEELANRSRETGFGDWIADLMLAQRPDADVALINSGELRLNQTLPAGSMLTREIVERTFEDPAPLVVLEVDGSTLWRAVENSLNRRGEEGWAHLAGVAVTVRSDGSPGAVQVRHSNGDISTVLPPGMARSPLPADIARELPRAAGTRIRVVTTAHVACGGDGYALTDTSRYASTAECQQRIRADRDPSAPAIDLKEAFREAVIAAGAAGIRPEADGRICEIAEGCGA